MNKVKVDAREYREYYTRRKQRTGTLDGFNIDNWEEVPDEDLWEDGEIDERECQIKIINQVLMIGDWKLLRRIDE